MLSILKMAAIFVTGRICNGPISKNHYWGIVYQFPCLFYQTHNSFTYLLYYKCKKANVKQRDMVDERKNGALLIII